MTLSSLTPLLRLVIRRILSLNRAIESFAIVTEPSSKIVKPRNLRLFTEVAALLSILTDNFSLIQEFSNRG
jgi:hypothetical protein